MAQLVVVDRATDWRRLKTLVLDSVSSTRCTVGRPKSPLPVTKRVPDVAAQRHQGVRATNFERGQRDHRKDPFVVAFDHTADREHDKNGNQRDSRSRLRGCLC